MQIVNPPFSSGRFTALSGSLIVYIDQQDLALYDQLTTTSGDLLAWVQEQGYVTELKLTTTSGDLVAQIPSLTGYATESWASSTFIDTIEMTTISGDLIAQIPVGGVSYEQLVTTSGDVVAQIPSLGGYATESWVSETFPTIENLTTTSGDIVAQIGESGGVSLEQLTTTSGDIVIQIPSLAGYATESWVNLGFVAPAQLTTTSGDIVEQIPSLAGYATESWANSNFIDNAEMTTTSGDIVDQIPSLTGYATEIWVAAGYIDNTEITTISGDLVAQMGTGSVTEEQLTTTSGDIVSQIPSLANYITSFVLTTASGDIVSQIPSLAGYATESWVNLGFITPTQLTTTSGDILAQMSGGEVTLEMLTTTSGDIVAQIGEGGGVTQEQLTTTSGDIVAQIGESGISQSQLTTTSGDIVSQIPSLTGYATESWTNLNFIDNSEMTTISGDLVSQIVGGGVTLEQLTTTSGDIVSYVDSNPYSYTGEGGIVVTKDGLSVTIDGSGIEGGGTTYSGASVGIQSSDIPSIVTVTSGVSVPTFGQGQYIGPAVTLSGGQWGVVYSVSYQMQYDGFNINEGYVWVEDSTSVISGSTMRVTSSSPMMDWLALSSANTFYVTSTGIQTYRMAAAKYSASAPDTLQFFGGATASGAGCNIMAFQTVIGLGGYAGIINLTGTNRISTSWANGQWTIDGSQLVSLYDSLGITQSGNVVPYSKSSLSSSTTITNTSAGAIFGTGQSTGLAVSVPPGNWNLMYSVAYACQADAYGLYQGMLWIEDGGAVVDSSSRLLSAVAPMNAGEIKYTHNIVNVTAPVATTYTIKASKIIGYIPDSLTIYGSTTASGTLSNFVAIPTTTTSGLPLTPLTISGIGGVTSYQNLSGQWIVDGTTLNDLRSGWINTGSGNYSTAKFSKLSDLVTITSVSYQPAVGTGQNTGLNVILPSGNWLINYSLSYGMASEGANNNIGLFWVQDDTGSLIDGSSSYVESLSPLNTYNRQQLSHTFYTTTTSARQYTIYGAKQSSYPPDSLILYGGVSASGSVSSILAWCPEVYATSLDLSTNTINHNYYNTYNTNYYESPSTLGLVSDGLNVTVSGAATISGNLSAAEGHFTVDAAGIKLHSEDKITSLAPLIRTFCGGRLERYSDTELRWNPVGHNIVGLYDGTQWTLVAPTGTISAANSFTTINGASVASGVNYDVYASYVSKDTFNLTFQEWNNDTTRIITPQTYQGVYVYDSTTTTGRQSRYLGIIRMDGVTGSKYFIDTINQRYIMNYYNKMIKPLGVDNPYSSSTSDTCTTSWRSWKTDGDVFKVSAICDGQEGILLTANGHMASASTAVGGSVSIGMDSKSPHASAGSSDSLFSATTNASEGTATFNAIPSIGYHYWYPLFMGVSTNISMYYYNSVAGRLLKSTFYGQIRC
jgi:hypothetical protein